MAEPPQVTKAVVGGIGRKRLIWIFAIAAIVWAFAINTGSTVFMIIVGVLTALLLGVLGFAWRMLRKQRRVVEFCLQYNAEFEIKNFDTKVDVCIERDAARPNPVGKEVITNMWKEFVDPSTNKRT